MPELALKMCKFHPIISAIFIYLKYHHRFRLTHILITVPKRQSSMAYLGGPCASPPPLGRTAVIFVTILGLFLAPFRDKIAATSDQMRFFGSSTIGCANFGPDWLLLFKVHEI